MTSLNIHEIYIQPHEAPMAPFKHAVVTCEKTAFLLFIRRFTQASWLQSVLLYVFEMNK